MCNTTGESIGTEWGNIITVWSNRIIVTSRGQAGECQEISILSVSLTQSLYTAEHEPFKEAG